MTDPTPQTPTRDEAPDVLAKQITAAASDMCEIARIASEWRNGPKPSLTAIREIRAVLASTPASAVDAAVKALEKIADEAKKANDVIRLNRDGGGQGRVKVATAMHRIAQWATDALSPAATQKGPADCSTGPVRDHDPVATAATPVSEDGEATSYSTAADPAKPTPVSEAAAELRVRHPTRRGPFVISDAELDAALAKPASSPADWLIRKGGYFYRPNKAGYTTRKSEAGRYTEADAKAEAQIEPGMKAIRSEDWPDDPASSPAGGDVREALEKARVDVVCAIAFLSRDLGTERERETVRGVIDSLVKTDNSIRAALSGSDVEGRGHV